MPQEDAIATAKAVAHAPEAAALAPTLSSSGANDGAVATANAVLEADAPTDGDGRTHNAKPPPPQPPSEPPSGWAGARSSVPEPGQRASANETRHVAESRKVKQLAAAAAFDPRIAFWL